VEEAESVKTAADHADGDGRRAVPARPWIALGLWLLALAVLTAVLAGFREDVDEASKALTYLMVVLVASARNGRFVGLTVAVTSFLAFNFFLLSPYYTLTLENPLDWSVLIALLLTGGVAAELFHRTQRAREAAESRAREIDRLSAIGAESLAGASAMDAVAAVARVIRTELDIHSVQVVMVGAEEAPRVLARSPEADGEAPDPELVRYAVREGRAVASGRDGTSHVLPVGSGMTDILEGGRRDAAVLLPLRVRDHVLGVIRLADPEGLHVDQTRAAFVDTLLYYAALAVERVRLEAEAEHVEALRKADRLKDALLASVSHDLRTPLTSIRATAAEIRAEGIESAAIIEEEADRLNRFVTDLLDLSRIRAGAVALDVEINAAEDLIGAALLEVRGLAGADRIDVRLPVDEIVPVGRFDFVHALRALVNLIENALRYTPAGASVRIALVLEPETLLFEVHDSGPGIPAEVRERVFEPFFRGPQPVARAGGTGLGLAIARSLAEAQGGGVDFRPGERGGSVFTLRLPRAELPQIP
jgi:two-component system, OmpR family, sensor histidine kinase KdpD